MSTLITEEYRRMQEELHLNPNYGVASVQYAPIVAEVVKFVGATELLDYGAGKGRLGETLNTLMLHPPAVRHYDPARPEWSAPAQPCACVACIDVLEHIEPELLDNVLDDLQRVTIGHGVFTVHTGPAGKVLADGRNAHLIQQPPEWWLERFGNRFDVIEFRPMKQGFWVLVTVKGLGAGGANSMSRPSGLLRRVLGQLFSFKR